MQKILDTIAEKISEYRKFLKRKGFSGEDLEQKVADKFNTVSLEYYTKMMALLSESDYQTYKKCVDEHNLKGVQEVLAKYEDKIALLRQQMADNF